MRLPDFFIIGAMKCATSTLHAQLNAQPGIFMSEPKEIYFFSDDPVYENGIDWYAAHFADATECDLVGESSTHYSKLPTYPHTVPRLKKFVPEAKFVYVMRHPVDRLVSQYIHQWTENEISADINESIYQHPELIDYSLYFNQLEPYIEAFGKGRLLLIFHQRLRQEPQEQLERVCRFIGFQGEVSWNSEIGSRNSSSERIRASKWRDALVYSPGISWIRRNLVGKNVREKVKELWRMQERPQLSESSLKYLRERFDEDLSKLGAELGVALDCENFDEVTGRRNYHLVDAIDGMTKNPTALDERLIAGQWA